MNGVNFVEVGIGLVALAGLGYWLYTRMQALHLNSNTAIHAKLDSLLGKSEVLSAKADATHQAALAPVSITMVPAAPVPTPASVAAADLPPWQQPPIVYDAAKDGPFPDFRAKNGQFRVYVDPQGNQVGPQGQSITPNQPSAADVYAQRRATKVLTGFGSTAFPAGRGAIQIKSSAYPCVVRTSNQTDQDPGMTSPNTTYLWFSADPTTARPSGTMGYIGSGYLQIPMDGYACYETDTGGVFAMVLYQG